jgi:hypothetical protein
LEDVAGTDPKDFILSEGECDDGREDGDVGYRRWGPYGRGRDAGERKGDLKMVVKLLAFDKTARQWELKTGWKLRKRGVIASPKLLNISIRKGYVFRDSLCTAMSAPHKSCAERRKCESKKPNENKKSENKRNIV